MDDSSLLLRVEDTYIGEDVQSEKAIEVADSSPDVEAKRDEKPRLGTGSLGNLRELGESVADATDVQFFRHGVESQIQSVYICGSFAEGSATAGYSDLDVRVVVDSLPAPIDVEDVERALRVEAGPEIIPEMCCYLDARIDTESPDEATPSVRIWDDDSDS